MCFRKITFLFFIFSLVSACAQEPASSEEENDTLLAEKINAYMAPLVADRSFMGSVHITQNEETIFSQSYGVENLTTQTPVTSASRFVIASNSKPLTAAAILLLQEQGKLSLQDSLSKFLPDFPGGDEITIRLLLLHGSGVANPVYENMRDRNLTFDDVIQNIADQEPYFEPGTNFSYSNGGYNILAAVVQEASGQTYEEYLRNNIFSPLGMTNAGDSSVLEDGEGLVTGYFPAPPPDYIDEIGFYMNPNVFRGPGSIYSTAADLAKWGNAVLNREIVDFFSQEYPYGWGREEVAGKTGIAQTGLANGFVSFLFVIPEEDVVITFVSNIQREIWTEWGWNISRIVFGEEVESPKPFKLYEITDPSILADYEGRFVKEGQEDRFLDITFRENGLWGALDGYFQPHYLYPTDKDAFMFRSFSGHLYFNREEDGTVSSFRWIPPESWNAPDDLYIKKNE